jgi:hypothetical protein
MKRCLFALAMSLACAIPVMPAAATPYVINYQLENVTFLDGGTASGSISVVFDTTSWSNTFSQLLAVDVTTTSGSLSPGAHYTNLNNWGAGLAGPSLPFGQASPWVTVSFLELSTPDQSSLLFLNYDASIPVTPDRSLQLIGTDQIPGEWHDGTRRAYASGSLVPATVPEPATWATFLGGLALAYFVLRRRKAALRI